METTVSVVGKKKKTCKKNTKKATVRNELCVYSWK